MVDWQEQAHKSSGHLSWKVDPDPCRVSPLCSLVLEVLTHGTTRLLRFVRDMKGDHHSTVVYMNQLVRSGCTHGHSTSPYTPPPSLCTSTYDEPPSHTVGSYIDVVGPQKVKVPKENAGVSQRHLLLHVLHVS